MSKHQSSPNCLHLSVAALSGEPHSGVSGTVSDGVQRLFEDGGLDGNRARLLPDVIGLDGCHQSQFGRGHFPVRSHCFWGGYVSCNQGGVYF